MAESFPGIPPAPQGDSSSSAPAPAPAAPAVAEAPPMKPVGADEEKVQPFRIRSSEDPDEAGAMMSEEQFMHDYFKENYTLPVSILLAGIGVIIGTVCIPFAVAGALPEAIAGGIGVVIGLMIGTLVATGVGWLVLTMFGDDYGSVPALFLRFAAVTATAQAVLVIMSATIGPFMALVLAYPITIAVVIFVAGVDILRAVIFCALLSAAWFTLGFLLLGVIGAAAFGGF